ncbi:hypothetical protein DFJ77DRAFT_438829 [Powellomyces hirtus]|nr:hypothetical protein DFJ77DRAFT_438829 [Powellomyces hirtus]
MLLYTCFARPQLPNHVQFDLGNFYGILDYLGRCFLPATDATGRKKRSRNSFPDYPCFVWLWGLTLPSMIWFAAVAARAFQFYFNFKINQAKLFGVSARANITKTSVNSSSTVPQISRVGSRLIADDDSTFSKRQSVAVDERAPSVSSQGQVARLKADWYYARKDRVSDRTFLMGMAAVILITLICLLIISAITKEYRIWPVMDVNGCKSEMEFIPLMVLSVAFFHFALPFLILRLRSIRDARGIRTDLNITIAMAILCLPIFLAWPKIFTPVEQRKYPRWFLLLTFSVVTHFTSVVLPTVEAWRQQRKRDSVKPLTNTLSALNEVLGDRTSFEAFKAFTALDLCVENTLFYEAYEELQVSALNSCVRSKLVPKTTVFTDAPLAVTQPHYLTPRSKSTHQSAKPADPSTQTTDAGPSSISLADLNIDIPDDVRPKFIAFYATYIAEGSPLEVNIPAHVREEVTNCIETSQLKWGMFEKAKSEVVKNMYYNSYPRFVKHSKRNIVATSSPTTGGTSSA